MQAHGLVDVSYVAGRPTGVSYPEHLERDGELLPRCVSDQTTSHPRLERSAWVWQTARLLADPQVAAGFIDRAAAAGMSRLFVQVHADLSSFASLFAMAKAHRITLYALSGDPESVLDPAAALATVDQVIAYNATHTDKFAGIQFDIEPHALPVFRQDPSGTLSRYVALIELLHARVAGRLPLGLAIPFWFDQKTVNGTNLLTTLLGNADELVLMSYRTSVDAIEKISASSLCLAQRSPTKVHLAVELAPIADEQHFISNVSQIEPYLIGDAPLAELRATPATGVPFLQRYTVVGSSLSFYPRQDEALAMMHVDLPFSNFNGWFINGLDKVWLHE